MTPREITDGQSGLFQQEIRQMTCANQSAEPPVSIMALHGLGKGVWEGMDAQACVAELRREWERTETRLLDIPLAGEVYQWLIQQLSKPSNATCAP